MSDSIPAPGIPPAGLMSHRPEDIARVLESLHAQGRPVSTFLGDNEGLFHSRLLFVDPQRHYIVIAAPAGDESRTLLSKPNLVFFSDFQGWHIEFSTADPQPTTLAGAAAIRLRFPPMIVSAQQRRMEPRVPVQGDTPLHCEADSAGFAPFDGQLVDISVSGVGFLVYGTAITLEPGTILRGCRIERPGKPPLVTDLEVRHSMPVVLPDGRHAYRSGCVFLNPTRAVGDVIDFFNQGTPG